MEVAWPSNGTIYVDTNIVIYFVEAIDPYAGAIRDLFARADRGEVLLVTSLLTVAETLVHPLRAGREDLAATCRNLLLGRRRGLRASPVDADVLTLAARLRANTPALRLPDAIHLATAAIERCDTVVTNDAAWSVAPIEIPVLQLP